MNHIVFCIDDNWCMPAGVLIKSILHYNSCDFTFHIISRNFSPSSKNKIKSIISETPNNHVEYYKVNDNSFDSFPIKKEDHVTIETYYRFLIPNLLPSSITKVLYLDCDILCTGSLESLFNLDISDYSTAMGIDTRNNDNEIYKRLSYSLDSKYHCAGVMLMNLTYWRTNNCSLKCMEYLLQYPELCIWHDQDAINKVLHSSIYSFNPCYDVLPGFYTVYDFLDNNITNVNKNKLLIDKKYWNDIFYAVENPCLIHFGGKIKPWHKYDIIKPYTLLWRKVYSTTPWKDQKLLKFNQNFKGKIKTIGRKLLKKNKLRYPIKAYQKEKYFLENY